jgi:hypothetical protein
LENHRTGFPQLPQGIVLERVLKNSNVNLSTKPGQAQLEGLRA